MVDLPPPCAGLWADGTGAKDAQMATFYVSTTGDDTADGLTLGSAFATLEQARAAMATSAGADTARVRGGTYQLQTPLVLGTADNGSNFAAFNGEAAVLSGGTALTGWIKGPGGIWTAPLAQADLHMLTLNGVQQTEARFPNQVPDDPVKGGWLSAGNPPPGADPRSTMRHDPADLADAQIDPGMKVQLFTDATWSSATQTVQSVDKVRGIITFVEQADFDLGTHTRFFVQDGAVHLDQPGEWFFDPASQSVHFKAPPGFDGTGVVAAGDHSIVEILGAQDVGLSGFTFSDAATSGFNGGFAEAAVVIQGSSGVVISGNSFVNLAQGVLLTQGSSGNLVDDNLFRHLWSSAVFADYGTNATTITNNDIRWVTELFAGNGAIQLSETYGDLVAHNLIRDVPRMGILTLNFDPGLVSGNHVIEFNTVLHSMQQTTDGGAIYTWSGADRSHMGSLYRYNHIVDAYGLEVRADGIFAPGPEYSNGIYLDDFTSDSQVYGNLIEGSVRGGIYLHGGSRNQVFDNIVLGSKDIGIQMFEIGEAMVGNDIHHNIVAAAYAPFGNTVELNPAFVSPGTLHDNFYWNPGGGPTRFSYGTFAAWQAAGFDVASLIFQGALFVDPASGDYHLRPGVVPLLNGFAPLPLDQMNTFRGGQIVVGSGGRDLLVATTGNDVLDGLVGDDALYGGAGDDDLTGGLGHDTLTGGAGADRLDGGTGLDRASYAGALSGVTVSLATGQGSRGDAAGDVLAGVENVSGSDFCDRLTGDAGANRIAGRAGADRIVGGGGADVLTGGSGADRFVFGRIADSGPGPSRDRISDFTTGQDRIDLRGIDADGAAGTGNGTFRFLAAGFDGAGAALQVRVVGLVTLVEGDVDGDGLADFQIALAGGAVSAGDILL